MVAHELELTRNGPSGSHDEGARSAEVTEPPTVKICGVRNVKGARGVRRAGADYAGLLFVPGRRRALTVPQAQALLSELGSVEPVGVFLDTPWQDVLHTAVELGLRTVQLHDHEPPDDGRRLSERGLRVIRAVAVQDHLHEDLFSPHADYAFAFLLDGLHPGSGQTLPESALQGRARSDRTLVPCPAEPGRPGSARLRLAARFACRSPVWLAGGLCPDNVRGALELSGADGVDVASGVEVNGRQDPERIEAFVKAARGNTP